MNKKPPLGSGQRFEALASKLAEKPGVRDPAALSAVIGRKKFGAKKFAALGKAAGMSSRHVPVNARPA